jgi:hypothetical protein
MTTRGAAFTELMRCGWALVLFTGAIKLAMTHSRIRIPMTIRTPFKVSLVFILYRHRRCHFRVIQLAAIDEHIRASTLLGIEAQTLRLLDRHISTDFTR